VTVKDQDGKEVFSNHKEYAVYDLHFAENKEGYIGLNDWDITAMDHIDLGIKPKKTDSNTFVIPFTKDTKSVNIEAAFSYLYEKGKTATIHTVSEKVDFAK
jgi:hypothetical protein